MRFYTIDNNYVKQLYQIDSEVFFEPVNYDTSIQKKANDIYNKQKETGVIITQINF